MIKRKGGDASGPGRSGNKTRPASARRTVPARADNTVEAVERATMTAHRLLAGHDPAWQSAVLADLLSLWVAGHRPDVREDVLAIHIELVRKLIPASELQMFGPAGHPGTPPPGEPIMPPAVSWP